MRKHISVFALFVRSTIFSVFALLLLMAVAEILLFRWRLSDVLVIAAAGLDMDSLEEVFSRGHLPLVFGLAFLVLTVLLCLPGCGFGSKTAYTIARLSISERAVFWWQVACNAVCYLLFWGCQLAVAMICCHLYAGQMPAEAVSGQTVFLAFYRSSFLHALLPLEDLVLWGRNLLLIAGLALSTARFPVCRRRGKISASIISMALTALLFIQPLGEYSMTTVSLILTLAVIVGVLWAVFGWGDEHEAA